MNRKMLITLAIIEILLIGSLIAIGSGNTNYTNTKAEVIDKECSGDCNNCDGQCTNSEECNSQKNDKCIGTDSCAQNRQMNKNCHSDCIGSGSPWES